MSDPKTLTGINEILTKGFPTDERLLLKMPFGFSMHAAFEKKSSDGENFIHRDHLVRIVKDMNRLLKGDVREIIRDRKKEENAKIEADWVLAWHEIHRKKADIPPQDQQMWRLEAFLHDVGKSLTYSKHASRGQYLITRLMPKDHDSLVKIVGQEKFNQIEKVIAFHDRFGVLSTGEASLAILADALDKGSKNDGSKKAAHTLSHIMVLNLIDIGASVPWGLICEKVKVVLQDWKCSCWNADSPLKLSKGDHGEFEQRLLELSATDEWTIERVSRLLCESYRRARGEAIREKTDFDAARWPAVEKIDFEPYARQALQTVCAGREWGDFKSDFAHIVKMDYLLYFIDKVTKMHWKRYGNPNALAVCIVSVILALIAQFRDLVHTRVGRSRIGIDLSVLRDTPEVQNQIAQLLSGDHYDATCGLEWLIHEAGAWPF